jgi:hypothetical protein
MMTPLPTPCCNSGLRGDRDVDDCRRNPGSQSFHRVIHRCQGGYAVVVQRSGSYAGGVNIVLVNEQCGPRQTYSGKAGGRQKDFAVLSD